MLKTEYREYIDSPEWQRRRKVFLAANNVCAECEMPRWLAKIAYDQDLNVHHLSYQNLGDEDWNDLRPLCRRCHEIEEYKRSDLIEPKSAICRTCGVKHWNPYSDFCVVCDAVFGTPYLAKKSAIFGKPINYLVVLLISALWVKKGGSRQDFLREVAHIYELGEEAASKIVL